MELKHSPLTNALLCVGAVITALSLTACTKEPPQVAPSGPILKIEITYQGTAELPPGSELRVALEDVSIADIAAPQLAEITVVDPGLPPYRLDLPYDSALIQQRMRYGIRAELRHKDDLLFINTTHIDPFAASTAPADAVVPVVMEPVGHTAHRPPL